MTPLAADGSELDERAIGPLVRFLSDGGIDGVLACGTTGEGILLSVDERRRVAERFLEARPEGFQVAVHAGAQTTADTVALATHAKEVGADAVAVIAPPYFPLDDDALFAHLRSAAEACGPLPVLRLRVRRAVRLRDPGQRGRTPARSRRRTSPA